MRTYAETALEKYAVLDPVLRRVTAFTEFLNAWHSPKASARFATHRAAWE
jgi:hypothetical protein